MYELYENEPYNLNLNLSKFTINVSRFNNIIQIRKSNINFKNQFQTNTR